LKTEKEVILAMKKLGITLAFVICSAFIFSMDIHAGQFGPPEPVSKDANGWSLGVGYFFYQDKFGNDEGYNKIRQHQIYLEASKSIARYFEVYLRLGGADATVKDAFISDDPSVSFDKTDYDGGWKPFETLGFKGYYPVSDMFGIGAFAQGTYYFGSFKDSITGSIGGIGFSANFEFKNWWNFTCGTALQAKLPHDILVYAGPYFFWSEITSSSSITALGTTYGNEDSILRNESHVGGYLGLVLPVTRQFRFNIEGQYSREFSGGITASYSF
jgi:hypothetical protein